MNDRVGTRRRYGFGDPAGIPHVQLQIGADHLGARGLETSLEPLPHEAGHTGHEHPHARRLPERTAHCYPPALVSSPRCSLIGCRVACDPSVQRIRARRTSPRASPGWPTRSDPEEGAGSSPLPDPLPGTRRLQGGAARERMVGRRRDRSRPRPGAVSDQKGAGGRWRRPGHSPDRSPPRAAFRRRGHRGRGSARAREPRPSSGAGSSSATSTAHFAPHPTGAEGWCS